MNRETYHLLAPYAGPALSRSCPWPIAAVSPFPIDANPAIYVATDREGRCCYVGSVARQGETGLADRVAAHLRQPRKSQAWHYLWVFPLHPETSDFEVRRIEGVFGAHLGPLGSERLPRLRVPIGRGKASSRSVR